MVSTQTVTNEGWYRNWGDWKTHYYFRHDGGSICEDRSAKMDDDVSLRPEPPIKKETCQKCFRRWNRRKAAGLIGREDLEQTLSEIAVLHPGRGVSRMELECDHQHGLVYVVDGAEMNWVCSTRRRPAHSLSGFFKELVEMKDPRIKELMNRWGIYYRPLPLAEQSAESSEPSDAATIQLRPQAE